MKKSYLFILLLIPAFTFAQNPQLFETNWHLTSFNDGTNDYQPPYNSGDPNAVLSFDQTLSGMQTNMCNNLFGSVAFEDNFTGFSLLDHYVTLSFCNNPANESFDSMYLGFFLGDTPASYTYSIIELWESKSLVITSTSGAYAVYSNSALSVKKSNFLESSIFPNPASDYIKIKIRNAGFKGAEMEIFNSFGALCKTEKITSENQQISISNLPSGVYVMKLKTTDALGVKKFIKI